MDKVTGKQLIVPQVIHAYQLNGKHGFLPITENTDATATQPCWIHLDYEQPEVRAWLNESELMPDSFKEAMAGESCRPRVARQGDGTLIVLRTINQSSESQPDPLVTLRVYLTANLLISSCHRPIEAVDDVIDQLQKKTGPTHTGSLLVRLLDSLTDSVSDFIDDLHSQVIDLENGLLEQALPERGVIPLIRKQLIVLRRHLIPQRDVFSRLASERFPWMDNDDRHHMQDIAERLGRGLDDLDATIARTAVVVDEINSLMADLLNRRIYTMSLMTMLFMPATFLTGLFGVNLGGIPGGSREGAFAIFCISLVVVLVVILWQLKRSKWI
ncbi:MAG: zinc transporter ZntB [Enterobacteriaceae bacterium]|nr:zinc transporter ZntB [Enterobacteriaceae bacterium]